VKHLPHKPQALTQKFDANASPSQTIAQLESVSIASPLLSQVTLVSRAVGLNGSYGNRNIKRRWKLPIALNLS
jgi:hypothetical protein